MERKDLHPPSRRVHGGFYSALRFLVVGVVVSAVASALWRLVNVEGREVGRYYLRAISHDVFDFHLFLSQYLCVPRKGVVLSCVGSFLLRPFHGVLCTGDEGVGSGRGLPV